MEWLNKNSDALMVIITFVYGEQIINLLKLQKSSLKKVNASLRKARSRQRLNWRNQNGNLT